MSSRRLLSGLGALLVLASSIAFTATVATAQDDGTVALVTVKVGFGQADASWHVGAGAGQYSEKSPDPANVVTGDDVDPHNHSLTQKDSYGVQSRLSYRAIVVQDGDGDQVAFVKSDSYLAQDYLTRRVGQILAGADSVVSYDEIMLMASHNHSSPYYTTPSWGVWLFQDAFDLRAFEYHARSMADAILAAEDDLQDAQMGATTVQHRAFKGMIQRADVADDGSPVGYPRDFGDKGLTVIRFDSLEDGLPIATMINWGQHPEGLDDHDLITGDFVTPLERFVERATGAPLVFGQGDVGSAEAGPGDPSAVPDGIPKRWSHAGHAQGERGAWLLAQDVLKGWNQIGAGEVEVPFSADFDVAAGNAFVPGPVSHPYPSVSNCRSHSTVEGRPGSPIIGLPDCERGNDFLGRPSDDGNPLNPLFENLKEHGIPVPEHYDAPGFTGVEENLRLKLQAFKIGEVILASCACEAQVDLILNLESRLDKVQDNIWLGYDWRERLGCTQNPDTTWTCKDPRNENNSITFNNAAYERMVAQIQNDAAGWNAPENAVAANAEPADPSDIWGNFTHEELSPELGYTIAVGVGHASDYNGYTVSYREYMTYDTYRKALTSYGPHTADYMNMWLQDLAESLQPEGAPLPTAVNDAIGQGDEARQLAVSTALGRASENAWEAWQAALPDDVGPAANITEDPADISRFDATTFSWRGGSNAVDNPVVRVQRQTDSGWVDFADQSGEVQTRVEFPNGSDALVDTYSGAQEWIWTANFEAFLALPVEIGSTPVGDYRFVVEGNIRQAGATEPYQLESLPFHVGPWGGLEVQDFQVDDGGDVSFVLPSLYPETYTSVFPYVTTGVTKGQEGGGPAFCAQCSFRPWATQIAYDQVLVTVNRADGAIHLVPATLVNGRWTADTDLIQGDVAFIAQDGVVDTYGESLAEDTPARGI